MSNPLQKPMGFAGERVWLWVIADLSMGYGMQFAELKLIFFTSELKG